MRWTIARRVAATLTLFAACAPFSLLYGQDVSLPNTAFTLNNGLHVIVHEDHKAPIVAINIWYHVGSANEVPGKTGFAHLFEHLMFGGSEHAKGRYIDALEQIGATDLNGTTNTDRTNFFETVPVSALDYALFLESDRMGYLTVTKETLELQRGVVQNEKRQGENRPYAVAEELETRNSYPVGHPYAHTVIGSMDDLNAASLEDVQKWFKTYYGPSNATLVLSGDITVERARTLLQKYFGALPPGPPVSRLKASPATMTTHQLVEAQDRVPQTLIRDTWNIAPVDTPASDSLDLISTILANGKDSRLYKRLVYDDHLATQVFSYIDPREIGGQFSIAVMAAPGVTHETIRSAVNEELVKLREDGPTPTELERVKATYESDLLRGLDAVSEQADTLASGAVFSNNPEQFRVSLERVRQTTTEQLREVAQRSLNDNFLELDIDPFPAYKAEGKDVDRSQVPLVGARKDLTLPKFQRATLSSGLRVILAERHELPLVEISLLMHAGYAADAMSSPGTANMVSTLLTEGTDKYNALQISDQTLALGAQLHASSTLDTSSLTLSSIKRNLAPSLELFANVLVHPSFPEDNLEQAKKRTVQSIAQEQSSPGGVALRVLPGLLFGKDHPYGAPISGSGTTTSVEKLTRADLVRFHETWFRPNNATLVVAGDTTLAEIVPLLERSLADWKAATVPTEKIPPVPAPVKSAVYLINRPGAGQSMLMAATLAPPKSSPDDLALSLWNDIVGGTFSSRVNLDLREDKHWTYGAHSLFSATQGQRIFLVQAPVQADKTKDALAELNLQLTGVAATHPPTQKELDAQIAQETLRLPGSRETTLEVKSALVNTVTYKLPDDYYQTYAAKVSALRLPDLEHAASSFYHPDQLVWIVVGDRAQIEEGVRALNLGDFHVLDENGNPLP